MPCWWALADLAAACGVEAKEIARLLQAPSDEEPDVEPAPEPPPMDPALESDDPWVVLGVARSASAAEIRRRYLELVHEHHPDRHAHLGRDFEEAANRRLVHVNNAYRELRR